MKNYVRHIRWKIEDTNIKDVIDELRLSDVQIQEAFDGVDGYAHVILGADEPFEGSYEPTKVEGMWYTPWEDFPES